MVVSILPMAILIATAPRGTFRDGSVCFATELPSSGVSVYDTNAEARLHAAQLFFSLPCGLPLQSALLRFSLPCGQGLQSAQLSFRLPCGQGLQSAHLLFSLPCGHGLQSAQLRFSLPCGQPLQSAQMRFSLPCGHGLQSAQSLFSLPCGHGLQSAQLCFSLPCGHGLQSAQLCFSLPCGHGLQSAQMRFSLPCGQGLQSAHMCFRLPCRHRFTPIAREPFTPSSRKPCTSRISGSVPRVVMNASPLREYEVQVSAFILPSCALHFLETAESTIFYDWLIWFPLRATKAAYFFAQAQRLPGLLVRRVPRAHSTERLPETSPAELPRRGARPLASSRLPPRPSP